MLMRAMLARAACGALLLLGASVPRAISAADAASPAAATVRRLDGSAISTARIDSTVTRLLDAAHVESVGIAIFNDARVVYQHAYGVRDKAAALPLTPDSVMTAASLSKPAFAYLVMQLIDERKLDLDRPVHEYLPKPLPEYERYQDLAGDPRWREITARMLLSHSSGLPNWRWIEDDKKLRLHFRPGARFAYSGEGIDLLQFVVESVTQKSLQELMQQRVFGPLCMQRSSMLWEPRFEGDHVVEYDEAGHSLGTQRRKRADAAGGMQTTLADYARFVLAAMDGQGLRNSSRAQMFAAQVKIRARHEFPTFEAESGANRDIDLSYGLGWGLYRTRYGRAIFKEGHDDGLRHYVVYFERARIGLLIMTNSANGESIYQELLETLLRDTFTPLEWERFIPYEKKTAGAPAPAVGKVSTR